MRRNPGATAALLQKANCQLRGEKIEKPEDELNAYISSLTQKTVKSQKAVNFEDLGESISISSDIDDAPVKPVEAVASGSKFLKKKPSFDEPDAGPGAGGNKFLKKPQPSTASPAKAATPQPRYGAQSVASSGGSTRPGSQLGAGRKVSSALDKVSALTGKIQQRAATRKTYTLESDSDESFSAVRISGTGDQVSESQTSDSVKIGRDGGKFLKKASPAPSSTPALAPARSVEPPLYTPSSKGKQTLIDKQASPQKKASPFTLKSSLKYSTDVVLTSEEESLAEYVGGLPSSSDSMDKPKGGNQYKRGPSRHTPSPPPKVVKGRHSPSPAHKAKHDQKSGKDRSVSPQNKPPMIRRTPSPSPRSPGLRRRSPSPKLMRSYSDDSNMADSIQDEVVDDFGMNVIMDLDDLGPADDLPDIPRPETPGSRSDSPVRSTARKSTKSQGRTSGKKGLQKDKGSPFKASKDKQTDKSPFRASDTNESPFKSSSNKDKSVFKANDRDSPFKASNKENASPFRKSGTESPFKAKSDSSPFRASNEGSLFKASTKDSSPFKSSASKKPDKDRSRSPFKAPPIRTASPHTDRSDSKKKGKKNKKAEKKTDKKKTKSSTDIFSSFGIQTVEDLLGQQSASAKESQSEYDDAPSQIEDIPSEVSDEIKTERVYSRQSSYKYDDSATEVASEIEEVKATAPTYTDDFDSISEKIGYSSDRDGRSSASEVRTRYSGEDTVASDTEYSESDTETETYTRSKSEQEDDSYSYTPSYTEDFTRSVVPTTATKSDMTPRPRRGMASAEVQTAMDGLYYSWDPAGSGMAYPGVPYGLHFVDPTPIAAHVVSADALEAMTAYSPAMLALHDMLKSQLELTREFVDMQKRMHSETSTNIQPRYHYTTLEDTKKYIKKHKKKKLSFKEALQLVDLEMARR